MGKAIDLQDKVFTRLTAIGRCPPVKKRSAIIWLCQCECGKLVKVKSTELISGHTKSCGCLMRERAKEVNTTHGMSKTRLYSIYRNMIQRCENANKLDYKHYGGRGIIICQEWRECAEAFFNWAILHGYSNELTLDRIDTNGNYEPSNCRWASIYEQRCNMRSNVKFEICGKTFTLTQLCRIYGKSIMTVKYRLEHGMTIMQALQEIIKQRR